MRTLALVVMLLSGAVTAGQPGQPDAELLREIERHFPPAKKWFGMVADLEFERAADGSLTPRYETLKSRFVLKQDPAGQVVMGRLPAFSTGAFSVWLAGHEGFSVRTTEEGAPRRAAELLGGLVVYRDAVAGGDLLYKLTPTHVDEYVYFRTPPSSLRRVFTVELGPGARELRQAGETLELLGPDGAARLRVSAPVARAADGTRRSGTIRVDGNRLIEELDLRGLTAPVLVDPDWTTTGTMTVSHLAHAGWRLDDGAVMGVGGCALAACPVGLVGEACTQVVPNTSVWTAASQTWTSGPTLLTARYSFAAVVLANNELLVAGGCTGSTCSSTTAATERYSKAMNRWVSTGALSSSRARLSGALLPNGDALLPGGCSESACLTEVARYETAANRWTTAAPLPAPRGFATTTTLADGSILLVGGCADPRCATVLADALRYDPQQNQWRPAGMMRTPRAGHSATLLRDGTVFIAGGCQTAKCGPNTTDTTELWHPAQGVFVDGPVMRSTRHHHTATLMENGLLLLAGGTDRIDSARGTAEVYLPFARRLAEMPRMEVPRAYHIAIALESGEVIVGGGCNAATCLPWAEVFNPAGLPVERPLEDGGTVVVDAGAPTDAGTPPVRDAGTSPTTPPDLTPFEVRGGPHPRLFRTGAVACADDATRDLACPVNGWRAQDGDFQPNTHPLLPRANDEVFDEASGLTWQARDDGVERPQAEAQAHCEGLATENAPAGTWRLPSVVELATLINFGRANPAIDQAFPDTSRANYWTATPVANANTMHWSVRFGVGEVMPMMSTNGGPARCVRGALKVQPPSGRVRLAGAFTTTDETVKDEAHGLEWQRADDGVKRSWRDSLDACARLSLAGHTDWHLPNAHELMSLLDYDAVQPTKLDPAFERARAELYWSSSYSANTPGLAWSVGFNYGAVDAVSVQGRALARCVRHLPTPAPPCRCGSDGGALPMLAVALLWAWRRLRKVRTS
ncbi:MAG: DUF1566 domain-containing protein [Myxococcaceae bacterium]|nr:DUF1566 domain-containing protein [Myxococcaceae bacterium]